MVKKKQSDFSRGRMSGQGGVTPGPLLEMITGFWITKTLTIATELGIFTQLSGRGMTLPEIARSIGIRKRPMKMLLNACVALGLLQKKNNRYRNTPLSQVYLTKEKLHYMGDLILMMGNSLYERWGTLKEVIINNRPVLMEREDREQLVEYINAMHGLGVVQADKISVLIDFSSVKTLLDMGGGSGIYSLVIAKTYPHLRAVIYDFPEVCAIAEKFIRQFKAQSQVSLCKGNLLVDDVPQGFDAVLLSQVLHEYGQEGCISILRKAYGALNQGGKLIINETLLHDEETGPLPSVLFSLNMLIHTPKGSSYSGKRIRGWLQKIGFVDVKVQSSESLLALVIARKPA